MTTEAGHIGKSGDRNAGSIPSQIENFAQALIAKYRSKETVMGSVHGAHWGVASGVAEQMKKGESFVAAVAAVFDVHPRSAEAVRLSALLILGGFLELLYREFPTLQRSGIAVGLLATVVFASHWSDQPSNPEKEEVEDIKINYENKCKKCGGSGFREDGKHRKEPCVFCKGTGEGNRKYIGDPL